MEVFSRKAHGRTYKYTHRYCTVCGTQFEAKLTDIKKGKGSTCSYSCSGKLGALVTNNKIPAKQEYYPYNNSHTTVRKAKEKGLINPEPCEVCGTTKRVTAHHEDYSKPLEVKWLCHKHHMQLHAKINKTLSR